ncbi:MAG TPA: hypothetical protein VH813_01905 [Candidatus Limnocylindrales bacterium]
MTVRSFSPDARGRRSSRVARTLAAVGAAIAILGATLPVVQAAPGDVVILTAGTAQVNGAKDANYTVVGTFGQNGSGATVATLYAVYNQAGCSGTGELFLFIKMATPGLTVRTIDNPSNLSFAYDSDNDGDADTVVPPNAGPAYSVGPPARTEGEFSVCYDTVDAPLGQGIAVTFQFSVAPETAEGRVARLIGATTAGDVGIHIATPDSGPPPAPSGTLQLPASPVRILDTRIDKGLFNKFDAHAVRSLQVAGLNGIPSTAIAVTGNLTVVKSDGPGFLAVTTDQPVGAPTVSTLNFITNETAANNLVTPLAADGTVWITNWSSAKNHVLLDITGYFVPGTAQADYVDVTPTRILDTRPGGTGLTGPFLNGMPRTITVGGLGGVPEGAAAVVGNLTVTGQTHAGYASLTTTSTNNPATSTVNFAGGGNRANGIVIKLDANTDMSGVVINGAGKYAHLIFDVTGYFTTTASGAIYHQVGPARLMDSRTDTGVNGPVAKATPVTLTVSPNAPVPSGATGVAGNLTVTGQTAAGFVSMTETPDAAPTTSTVNFPVGVNRANGVLAPLSSGDASFTYSTGATGSPTTEMIFDVTGYFAP